MREIIGKYIYIKLRERPELIKNAANWFHSKWGVPTEAYLDCMNAYLGEETEYGWYLCLDSDKIIGDASLERMLRRMNHRGEFGSVQRQHPCHPAL